MKKNTLCTVTVVAKIARKKIVVVNFKKKKISKIFDFFHLMNIEKGH
jgi:hypothetical protein